MRSIPIGTTSEHEITVKICGDCGCVIGETGECSYECGNDFTVPSERNPASMTTRVWRRVSTLISEVHGVAPEETQG